MTRWLASKLLALAPPSFSPARRNEVLDVLVTRVAAARGWRRLGRAVVEVVGVGLLVLGLRVDRVAVGGTDQDEGRGENMLGTLGQDLRFAVRTMTRNPGYAFVAITVLALAVGANTAIFSAVNAFFFRPLPFADEERLVTIYETNPDFGWDDATAAPANLLDWREEAAGFDDVSGYAEFTRQVTTFRDGEPILVGATEVVGNFFSTLGVPPELGRTFRMDETWEGAGNGVVISHRLWVQYFGSDPDVVGKSIEFSGGPREVLGVMPAGFNFPSERTDLWSTVAWDPSARGEVWFRRAHIIRAFGRLAPGIDLTEADAQLQVVVGRLQEEYPGTNSVMGAGIMPMRDFLISDVRTQLTVLLGAVALLLLLACTNVANLMLVRANGRMREVALRRALGAGRLRVARQLFTEGGLIALCGGVVGLVLGWIGVRAITTVDPLGIEGATSLTLDHRVILFTVAATTISGLLFGTVPALRVMEGGVDRALRDGGRGSSGSRKGLRTVNVLVTAEVAVALLLVVGAGLMVRTFVTLRSVDPGFETAGVAAVQFTVPSSRYQNRDLVLGFYDELIERLEARPGVDRVGTVGQLPLNGTSWSSQLKAEGWPAERIGWEILHRRADGAFFEAMGTPLLRGRLFGPDDGPDAPLVVVVNETFAQEHFPGEDPIGQRIAYVMEPTEESYWYEIIGIVGDQHQQSPAIAPRAEVFENRDQDWGRDNWVVVRGDVGVEALLPTIRAVLAEMDPLIPIARTETLREVWSRSMARETLVLQLLGIFAVVALLLASVGVYGVTAQAARRRTQEIGIRMALGAGAPDVLRMMLRQGVLLIGVGLAIGLGVALVAARSLASFLFGVEPTDPLTLVSVSVLLGAVALLACYIPARRATVVDPVRSLSAE